MAKSTKQQELETLRQLRQNPQAMGFLNLLAKAEGTLQHGYNTNFGGSFNPNLSAHPGKSYSFTQTDGKKNRTTASGRYQFILPTWERKQKQLGVPDFGAESQDIVALSLIKDRGALNDVIAGDYRKAISKLGAEWASLPSSNAKQPKRSYEYLLGGAGPATLSQALVDSPQSIKRAYDQILAEYVNSTQPLTHASTFAQTQALTKGMDESPEQSPLGAMFSATPSIENLGVMTSLSDVLSRKK